MTTSNTAPARELEPSVTERPSAGNSLAVLHRDPMAAALPHEVVALVAEKDEAQILAACMGSIIDEWVYEFKVGGKLVEGISVTGAMEIARIRAESGFPIRLMPMAIEEVTQNEERGMRCLVIAREARTGAEGMGMAFYPFYPKDKEGKPRLDDKADRKALSVAKRNAVLDIIPYEQALALLRERKKAIAANERDRQNFRKNLGPVKSEPAKVANTDPYADADRRVAQPAKPTFTIKGTPLPKCSVAELTKAIADANASPNPERWAEFIEACSEELALRARD